MECPRCAEPVDAAAAYCGNCGIALQQSPLSSTLVPTPFQPPASVVSIPSDVGPAHEPAPPTYAVVRPDRHALETKSMATLIISVLALPASVLPVAGWILGGVGIVAATILRPRLAHKAIANVAIVFGVLAALLSGGVFAYNVQQYNKQQQMEDIQRQTAQAASVADDAIVASSSVVNTPCYSVDVGNLQAAESDSMSCRARAYTGSTLLSASEALTIEAVTQRSLTEASLAATGKEIADNYLSTALSKLEITSQGISKFAGSPAYHIQGKQGNGADVDMLLVLHESVHGENAFVLTYATSGSDTGLEQIESSWVWR